MANGLSIAELLPGVSFEDCVYLRKNTEVKTAKNGEAYLLLTLADSSGQNTGKKFQATEHEITVISQSRFLSVSGSVEKEGQFKGSVSIKKLTAVEQPENVADFLSPFSEHHGDHQKRFCVLLKSIQEPNLSALLRDIFDAKKETWEQFKSASAAKFRHHAYRGGLIEHTMEVAELCDKACLVLTHLRRDFLVTGALLHDIGKLDEMEHGLSAGEFTECGTLVGHTVSGAMRIAAVADGLPNFPLNLKSGLVHMLLSHHGRIDFGAARTPACAEAWVLHECDNMSAKSHEYQHISSANITPGLFSVKSQGEYYFIGDLGLQTLPEVIREPTAAYVTQPREIPTFHTTKLRIRGLVAAGAPEQGNDEAEEMREVVLPACGADFLVRVTGDSMADEGIREHDVLFVKEIESPRNGDIVVAHVGATGEVVKRYRSNSVGGVDTGAQWLESENSSRNYPDIPVDGETRIRGKVVGLLRDF
jgi:3'-5' exoribonuclease